MYVDADTLRIHSKVLRLSVAVVSYHLRISSTLVVCRQDTLYILIFADIAMRVNGFVSLLAFDHV